MNNMVYILARKNKTKEILSSVRFENRLKDRNDVISKCFKTLIHDLMYKNVNFKQIHYEILESSKSLKALRKGVI